MEEKKKKLSEFNKEELTKEDIDRIIFSNIEDSGESCYYALVFGHAILFKERTQKAIEIYKQGRAQKLVFMGGGYGDSNTSNDHVPESHKMKDYAIKKGVIEKDIIIEDKSTNTEENLLYTIKSLNLDSTLKIMLITSGFHLKRCNGLIKKMIPGINTILVEAKDIIHDREHWHLNDNVWDNNGKHGSGKSLVENEAKVLIEGASNGKIEDFEI